MDKINARACKNTFDKCSMWWGVYRHILNRWPEDPQADEIRMLVDRLLNMGRALHNNWLNYAIWSNLSSEIAVIENAIFGKVQTKKSANGMVRPIFSVYRSAYYNMMAIDAFLELVKQMVPTATWEFILCGEMCGDVRITFPGGYVFTFDPEIKNGKGKPGAVWNTALCKGTMHQMFRKGEQGMNYSIVVSIFKNAMVIFPHSEIMKPEYVDYLYVDGEKTNEQLWDVPNELGIFALRLNDRWQFRRPVSGDEAKFEYYDAEHQLPFRIPGFIE